MYGAMLGDIIGSPFEFYGNRKEIDFPLFSNVSKFTDDTLMTFGICNGILAEGIEETDEEKLKASIRKYCRVWETVYPKAGYKKKNFSYNDGTPISYEKNTLKLMGVSSVGWLYESLEKTRKVARLSSFIISDTAQEAAESVVSAIWLARNGYTKEDIRKYITSEFGYNLDSSISSIKRSYNNREKNINLVSESIISFLESSDFEESVRTAVSLGGDADTQAAIAGSIAEAYFGIERGLVDKCRSYMTRNMVKIMNDFDKVKLPVKERA